MSLISTKLNVAYSLGTTPEFVFTDVTDYSAQTVVLSDITGVIEVTAPSGIVYTGGSPDITGSASRINSTTILIPLLANGSPEVGNYSFKYTATDGTDTVTYTVGFDFQYISPTGILTPTVDCLSPNLKATDDTNYLSGSTTPSDQFDLTAVSSVNNTFTISGEKSGLFKIGDTFNVISSTANDGNYTVTSVSSTGSSTVIGVASITNSTVDGKISTKTNTIYYPPSLALAPVVGYEPVVSTNTFYSQTQSFKVITKSFYDFGNGVSVIDTVSASSELDVDCDVRLCEVFCCINSTLKGYLSYRGVNDVLANQELNKYILATSHLSALRQAFECGYDKEVNSIVQEIMTVTQCTPDCSCSDTTPQPITGLGAANITVVNSSGNGVIVSPSTVGNTTTYTLGLSQAVLNSITAATATSSVVSTDGSVTITSSTASGNTAYDLSIPAPAPAVAPVEFMSLNVELAIVNGVKTFTIKDQVIQGVSNLQTPTISYSTTGTSGFNPKITVSGFQSSANNTYKMDVSSYFQEFSPLGVPLFDSNSTGASFSSYYLVPTLKGKSSGSFSFALLDKDGNVTQGGLINLYSKIYFNIKIYE
tara:strand:- start:13974 stop:15749 length:1776 start_codon:yes stop_codon:yes gene_type:complete